MGSRAWPLVGNSEKVLVGSEEKGLASQTVKAGVGRAVTLQQV